MNDRFDFDLPQELRELTDSNIFFKYTIYFSCLTGVLVELERSQKTVTQIDSSNEGTQTTIRSYLIQDVYLKCKDGSEEHIEFIDSNIKAIKDHLLTLIFVRYPRTCEKEFLAVYNHNLKESFHNLNFDKERWSNFSNVFRKAQFIIKYIVCTIIVLVILIVFCGFISYVFQIYSENINFLIWRVIPVITVFLILISLFIDQVNDVLMKQKIHKRVEKILESLKNQRKVKDTTDFEYIDEWN